MFNIGGVARFGLQSPHESGRLLGKLIDVIQAVEEFLDLRVIQGMQEAADVQLREVEGHKSMVADSGYRISVTCSLKVD